MIVLFASVLVFFASIAYGSIVNLNTASYKELLRTPGVTPQMAHAFILYREKYGHFNSPEEMLNACLELDIAMSEEYIEDVIHKSFIYSVSSSVWNSGIAENFYDLIHPMLIYNINMNYLVAFPDGGWMMIKNTPLSKEVVKRVKEILPPRFLARPVIDWLIVNDIIGLDDLEKNFKVTKVYSIFSAQGKNINTIKSPTAIDLYQTTYHISCELLPTENRIEVTLGTGEWNISTQRRTSGKKILQFPENFLAVDQKLATFVSKDESQPPKPRRLPPGVLSLEQRLLDLRDEMYGER